MGRVPSRVRRVVGPVAMLLFGLSVSELLLRVAKKTIPTVTVVLDGLPPWHVLDPVLGFRFRPGPPDRDSRGYRNRLRPAHVSIVAMGDSMTQGLSVRSEQAWPQVIGVLTGLPTYNMGVPGYGPGQYVALLDEALELTPEVVLVALYSGNDAADAYDMIYERQQLRELRSPDPEVAAAVERASRTRAPLDEPWQETRAQLGLRTPRRRLPLELAALARAAWYRMHRTRAARGWLALRKQVAAMDPDVAWVADLGTVRTILTPRARLAALDHQDPRVLAGEEVTVRALRLIRSRTPGSTHLAVVLIPTKELVFYESLNSRSSTLPSALRDLVREETVFWDRVRRELDSLGVDAIDALPALRAVFARGANPYREDEDSHPNAAGYDAIATLVANSSVLAPLRAPSGAH